MAKAWLFFMTQKGMVKQPLAATPKKRRRKLRGTKEICSYQHLSRRFLIGFWCCVRRGGQVSYCSHLGWSHLLVPRQCVATSSATMAQFSKPLSGTLLTYTTFVESPPSMHWRTVLHMTDEQKKIFVWKIIRVVRTCWHWKHKRTLQTNFQIGNSEGCESLLLYWIPFSKGLELEFVQQTYEDGKMEHPPPMSEALLLAKALEDMKDPGILLLAETECLFLLNSVADQRTRNLPSLNEATEWSGSLSHLILSGGLILNYQSSPLSTGQPFLCN